MARLNIQGLARREPLLVKCIKPRPGHTVVSMDLASGEPAVTSHYSGDRLYRYCTIDGIGKKPFYDGDTLYIDDIYIAVMAVSPMHKQILRDYFDSFDFVGQWLKDPEVIKTALKKHRQVCKMLALALAYGMQPKKMVKQMLENGYSMTFKDAKAFYHAYWQLFSGVRQLADRIEAQVRQDGFLINEFGYRLTPEPRKGFNALIQSSVSGIIHVLTAKLFALASYARLITVIHDELLVEVPDDRLAEFKLHSQEATRLLNEELSWSVNIRVGFTPGKTFYDAK